MPSTASDIFHFIQLEPDALTQRPDDTNKIPFQVHNNAPANVL